MLYIRVRGSASSDGFGIDVCLLCRPSPTTPASAVTAGKRSGNNNFELILIRREIDFAASVDAFCSEPRTISTKVVYQWIL